MNLEASKKVLKDLKLDLDSEAQEMKRFQWDWRRFHWIRTCISVITPLLFLILTALETVPSLEGVVREDLLTGL